MGKVAVLLKINLDLFKLLIKAINMKGNCSYHFNEFIESTRMVEQGIISGKYGVTKMFSIYQVREAYEYRQIQIHWKYY